MVSVPRLVPVSGISRKKNQFLHVLQYIIPIGSMGRKVYLPTLPETNILHLKMDGWKTTYFPFGKPYFQVLLLLVSGSVIDL